MTAYSKDEAQAIKDWYNEWAKIPNYLATVSFALIAFSFSQLLPPDKTSSSYLANAWLVLIGSAALSFLSMVCAYASFDLSSRLHLSELIAKLGLVVPAESTRWIRCLGKVSFYSAIIASILILSGISLMAGHVFVNLSFK